MQDTVISHFWAGHFTGKREVDDYFAEVWDKDDEDREHTPLSMFARDQGQKWYDHDYLEYSFGGSAASIQELVAWYSYSEQWAGEFTRRVAEAGLSGVNMLVFIEQDQIDQPRSVKGDGYWLHYLGTIRYGI